jgi:hypothetical protein
MYNMIPFIQSSKIGKTEYYVAEGMCMQVRKS